MSFRALRTCITRGAAAFYVLAGRLAIAQVPGGGGAPVRPLWTEAAITVGMVGLVLFAVCRSSNRT